MPSDLPVLLVPGMLCDPELWTAVRDDVGPRAVDVEISAPSIGEMAEQVLASVDGEFVLIGLSLGAIAGIEVLRRAPGRVAGFVAISTNAAAPTDEQLATWRSQAERVRDGGFDRVVRDEILPAMFASDPPPEVHAERFVAMARRIGPDVFLRQLAAQATRSDAFGALRYSLSRSLVVCGSADALCPVSFHRRITAAMPHADLRVVPGAGHLLPLEHPHVLSGVLRDWLRELAPVGP
ncbi:MAG: alpha/beta fold hydrolase [Actinophytocola sp.]|nr:alpha/beta fold hydrolase [Actinophytocola sp.]